MNKIKLYGCTPDPLMSILKALGIFRIISEQADTQATACWKNDIFELDTNMAKEELVKFFLEKYVPTPIVSPWNNGSGFYDYKDSIIDTIKKSKNKRFERYQITIKEAEEVITRVIPEYKEFVEKKNRKKSDESSKEELKVKADVKPLLLTKCRNTLENSVLPWLDAVYAITSDKPSYGTVLGTGGNDGNFEISKNFMTWLTKIIPENKDNISKSNGELEHSYNENLIKNALFHERVNKLENSSFAFYYPGGYIGEASKGGGKITLMNPWDFILTIEGTMLFTGSVSRRFNSQSAVFPFTPRSSTAGYATACNEETRKEIWIPLWGNPATYEEIKYLFNEGRAQINSKNVESGVEFSRAIVSLGTERGLSEFQRFGLFERKGRAYFANNIGRVKVTERQGVELLSDLDEWVKSVFKASQDKKPSKKQSFNLLDSLLRTMDGTIIKFCTYGTPRHLQEVLIVAGKIERMISKSSRHHKKIYPMPKLSFEWINKCYDGTKEFRLAMSIASISSGNPDQIRKNIEPIIIKPPHSIKWKVNSPNTVWRNTDLRNNMISILERRCIDRQTHNSKISLASKICAPIKDVIEFIEGNVDYNKIANLILPLSTIDHGDEHPGYYNERELWTIPNFVPEAYIVLKSNFPPIIPKNKDVAENTVFEPTIIKLFNAGRINEAVQIGRRRLHITGYPISTYLTRDIAQSNTPRHKKNFMASLLFPIDMQDMRKIILRICDTSKNTINSTAEY